MVSTLALPDSSEDILPLLQRLDTAAREEFALAVPDYTSTAAVWAARLLYQLCQFVVCRDIGSQTIAKVCAVPCPAPRSPETDWSVDLTLRHLPRVFQLARHLSHADPLLEQLRLVARAWPLSSVGIPDLKDFRLDSFLPHPALRRLYLDRIMLSDDVSRLENDQVSAALRADLGLHRELAPAALAAQLFGPGNDTH